MSRLLNQVIAKRGDSLILYAPITTENGPFAASGHMVHAGGQAAHWDIQNKATSSR